MNTALLLPREVSALVHHVELNRAGWSDKTLNRLVLATVWLAGENLDETQICRNMQNIFSLTVGNEKLASAIESLKAEDSLIEVSSGVYRIPDRARSELEREIGEAEDAETKARKYFHFLVTQSCPDLDASHVWNAFEHKFLVPMMRDIGANTYRLIAGEVQIVDEKHVERILTEFGQEHRSALKAVVASFLDPKKKEVRDYITRTLHAYFCVEASGISESVVEKLKTTTAQPLRFRLFVDTNFLFSLLGLHENPSNASADELKDLLATLRSNPQVDLYVIPKTIEEAKRTIAAVKDQVSGVAKSRNFTGAALRTGMSSGLIGRFFAERQQQSGLLTADDWFDPYLNNFVPLAQAAGVELYNENLDHYGSRQDVVDDIDRVMEHEKNKFPKERRKTYEKVAHDIILWHSVKDKRRAYVESPADAKEWILTLDFRLIGFDTFKLRQSESHVPLCLHPASLIQLLQFWVPRTQKFEEAILGGLRLPFLFQEFDATAERLSLAIISRLGLFQGSQNFPEETIINVVMNDSLRSRISDSQPEEEIQLVHDALVEEMRLQVETEKAKGEELTAIVEDKSLALAEAREETKSKDAEIKELQKRLSKEAEKSRTTGDSLAHLTDEQSKLKSKVDQMEEEKLQRKGLLTYLGLLVLVVGLSVITGWLMSLALPVTRNNLVSDIVYVASGVCIFVIAHLLLELSLRRHERFKRLWPFRQVMRFRKRLWGLVITLLLGVAGSLIAGDIQNGKDTPPSDEPSKHSRLPGSPELPTEIGDEP